MRTVIIGSGSINNYDIVRNKISDSDFIICADGGYNHARALGIAADLLIGDFDSISEIPEDILKIKYPVEKDMTDAALALEAARDKGSDEILLFGFTGDRQDHTITNILMLLNYPEAVIFDDNNEIRILSDKLTVDGRKGQTLSIIPIRGNLEGVTTTGLLYPLNNETLYLGKSRGVSNIMTENSCTIECKGGRGLIIKVENI